MPATFVAWLVVWLTLVTGTVAQVQSTYNLHYSDEVTLINYNPSPDCYSGCFGLPCSQVNGAASKVTWWGFLFNGATLVMYPLFHYDLTLLPNYAGTRTCVSSMQQYSFLSNDCCLNPNYCGDYYDCSSIYNAPSFWFYGFNANPTSNHISQFNFYRISSTWTTSPGTNSISWSTYTEPDLESAVVSGGWTLHQQTYPLGSSYYDCEGDVSSAAVTGWWYVSVPTQFANHAIATENGQLSFRFWPVLVNYPSYLTNYVWDTATAPDASSAYDTYMRVAYAICDPNASCNAQTGACVCNSGYTGNGYSCSLIQCAAVTAGNAAFPVTNSGGSGTTVTGSCLAGYSGTPPTYTCTTSGTWSNLVGSCSNAYCPAQTGSSSNGYINLPSVQWGSNTISGSCSSGYLGSPSAVCSYVSGSTGTWGSFSGSCTPANCPASSYGGYNWPQTASGNTASQSCPPGQTGTVSLSCSAGRWASTITGSCATIYCPTQSSNPSNGLAAFPGSTTAAGSTSAVGQCPTGWQGSPQQNCLISGSWDTTNIINPCTVVRCSAISSNPSTGTASYPLTVGGTSSVSGSCPTGWYGAPTRNCVVNGNSASWSIESNPCTQIQCSALTDDNHANWPTTNAGAKGTGQCVTGWTGSVTSPTRACDIPSSGTIGTWSSAISNPCVQNSCSVSTSSNANWPVALGGTTAAGVCLSGFSGAPTQVCGISGSWSGTYAGTSCTPVTCPATTDGNAQWSSTPLGSVSSVTAKGTCLTGFHGSPLRVCLLNTTTNSGLWEPISNPCKQNVCPSVVYANASFGATSVNLNSAISVSGTCNPGFVGSVSRICNTDGTWGSMTGTCTQLYCSSTQNATVHASWNKTAANSFGVVGTCDATFYGSPKRDCEPNGQWSSTISNPCSATVCPVLLDDNNANWINGTVGYYSNGTCLVGLYQNGVNGPPTRLCQMDGSWGPVQNPCVQITCPSSDTSGNANWPSTAADTLSVQASNCLLGYSPSSSFPSRSCALYGVWSNVSNPCVQNYCPSDSSTGHASWVSSPSLTTVTGACNAGYQSNGVDPTRYCYPNGTWAIVNSPCVPIYCPALTDDPSTNANWPRVQAGSTSVSGKCVSGYESSTSPTSLGPPIRACSINGTWSTLTDGGCQQIYCSDTTEYHADWRNSPAGSTVNGSCNAGWNGTATRQCSIMGVWQTPTSNCSRITCSAYTNVNNGVYFPQTDSGKNATGTCQPGWAVTKGTFPSTLCELNGQWSSTIFSPCTRIKCDSLIEGHAQWPSASVGTAYAGETFVAGTCVAGWYGSPTRNCSIGGNWDPINPSGACQQYVCSSVQQNSATYPSTLSGAVATGSCDPGFSGTPQRLCKLDGNWDANVINPCTQIYCQNTSEIFADWPKSPAMNTTVYGSCWATYQSNSIPSRFCDYSGSWGPIQNPCSPIYCNALTSDQFSLWPSTRADTVVNGTCVPGYVGSPTRTCLANGQWTAIDGPCQQQVFPCPTGELGYAAWPNTLPGIIANGTCNFGYAGSPQRLCPETGVWNDTIINQCAFTNVPTNGRLENFRATYITSSTIVLAWTNLPTAKPQPTRYRVLLSADSFNFAPWVGGVVTVPTAKITGLQQYTIYYFRVFAGDNSSLSFDTTFVQLAVTTTIDPPSNLHISDLTKDSLKLTWNASALASFYSVSVSLNSGGARRASVASANNTNSSPTFTPLGNVTGTSYDVKNLQPGTSYSFKVQAGLGSSLEPVGVQVFVSTPSAASPQSSAPIGPLVGGIFAGIIVVLLAMLSLFIIYRRRQAENTKKLLDEYSSQVSMNSMTLSRQAVIPSTFTDDAVISKNLTVQENTRTQLVNAEATLMNTVLEVALPGFLVLEYTKDLRIETKLTAGGSGTISRGVLLDQQLVMSHGTRTVAVKEVTGWPGISEEEQGDRFHQEVAIMWSLSFHPNIIKLIGYTDSPRTIITRLYPTDLFRLLHHHQEDNKTMLDSPTILYLCNGMISGLAAVHSMNIAHRDIKTPNILLGEPVFMSYPEPIICDFGLSRTSDESGVKKFSVINGFSPKYTPPEVFARVHLKSATNTIEDDKMSDVYSMGVVFWETMFRQIPWDGIPSEKIELSVREGNRVPQLPFDEKDDILFLLSAIIENCLQTSPEGRPTSVNISSKLSSFTNQRLGTP